MATPAYEDALHAAERLTVDEQRRLQAALAALATQNVAPSDSRQTSGAALVATLEAQPPDPATWEKIEQIIEDECEYVDSGTW